MNISERMEQISFSIEQIFRVLIMQLFLAPAAYVFPKKIALFFADVTALLLMILPRPGYNIYWQMRSAFGKNRRESCYLAYGWLVRPLRDYVALKRIQYGYENPFDWRIVEKNIEGINSLRKSGNAYIIASAHFPKEPGLSVLSPSITSGHPINIAGEPRKRIQSLYDLRIRVQYRPLLHAISTCWGRDVEIVYIGSDLRSARTLYKRLCERGNVVYTAVDAIWHKTPTGSFERPFAGHKSRVFSTGAAQLARLARCPIISCVCFLEDDGNIVLEWGKPIHNTDKDAGDDIDVMNKLIDTMEIAIGENPTQYIYEIGSGRRWNPKDRRWENLPECVSRRGTETDCKVMK